MKDKESNQENKPQDATKPQQNQSQEAQKGDTKEDKGSDAAATKMDDTQKMSDDEERKWIEMLGKNVSSYMYKLSDEKTQKSMDEKPW